MRSRRSESKLVMKNNPAMAIPHSQPPKNKTMLPIKAAAIAAEGVRKFRQHATVAATQLMTTDSHIPAVTISPAQSLKYSCYFVPWE